MATAMGVRTHVRRAAEAGDALGRNGRTVAGQIDLSVEPMNFRRHKAPQPGKTLGWTAMSRPTR